METMEAVQFFLINPTSKEEEKRFSLLVKGIRASLLKGIDKRKGH